MKRLHFISDHGKATVTFSNDVKKPSSVEIEITKDKTLLMQVDLLTEVCLVQTMNESQFEDFLLGLKVAVETEKTLVLDGIHCQVQEIWASCNSFEYLSKIKS